MRINKSPFFIAGIDEAGRGPLAGPVGVAGVVLPAGFKSKKITDSKKLSLLSRNELFLEIKETCLAYSCILISPEKIDQYNILRATMMGMEQVAKELISKLKKSPSAQFHFLVDGNRAFCNDLSVEAIIKGDGKIKCIGAASILAKVARDTYMEKIGTQYPEYEFHLHKGYPTRLHKERIQQFGPCPIHRKTFSGVKEYCETNKQRSGEIR
jgi:ribonuclease HII